jgi:hypothetical protein
LSYLAAPCDSKLSSGNQMGRVLFPPFSFVTGPGGPDATQRFPALAEYSLGRTRCENAGRSHSDRHLGRIVPLRSDRIHCRTDHLWIVSNCVGHLWRHLQGSPAAGNKHPSAGSNCFCNRLARTSESLAFVGVQIRKSCVALINVLGSK